MRPLRIYTNVFVWWVIYWKSFMVAANPRAKQFFCFVFDQEIKYKFFLLVYYIIVFLIYIIK